MNLSTSRRSFLGASVAALAATRTGFGAAPEDPPDFKLGIATYSLRKFRRGQAIAMLKQMKVKYINIKDVHLAMNASPQEIRAGRREFEDAGFIIEGGGN